MTMQLLLMFLFRGKHRLIQLIRQILPSLDGFGGILVAFFFLPFSPNFCVRFRGL